jgi:ribosomal protein L2
LSKKKNIRDKRQNLGNITFRHQQGKKNKQAWQQLSKIQGHDKEIESKNDEAK